MKPAPVSGAGTARRRWRLPSLLCWLCGSAALVAAPQRVRLDDGLVAVRSDQQMLFVEAEPSAGEGLLAFARRVSGDPLLAPAIAAANGGLKKLEVGRRYRVPVELLVPELRWRVTRALFPDDRPEHNGWRHLVKPANGREPEVLWRISTWFTGRGENFAAIRAFNGLRDEPLPGTAVLIPAGLLLAEFRGALPPPPRPASPPTAVAAAAPLRTPPAVAEVRPGTPSAAPAAPPRTPSSGDSPGDRMAVEPAGEIAEPAPTAVPLPVHTVRRDRAVVLTNTQPIAETPPAPSPAVDPPAPATAAVHSTPQAMVTNPATSGGAYHLRFDRDAAGEYAVYALEPGEALYSSVVVRFTGRIHADDVNALAAEIAERSGIVDVTDIPVGYPVKVPLDLMQPEFLLPTHPRRQEYEASMLASARFRNQVEAVDLEGITVVLDAGHGGRDVGASLGGVWESLYVYDVMVRVRKLLDEYTAAKVVATTRDGKDWKIEDKDVLGFSRGHAVLTTPPYPIADSKVGVNLRWYLANSVERQARKGGAADKMVFVSIHADSLHPSLRGAMAYIPDAGLSGAAPARSGGEYSARREVREAGRFQPSRKDLQRYEGLSRDLAEHVIAAFRDENLPVHPFKPVREKIIRGRRAYVPAVLRYNAVPAKILLEVSNLANAEDRALLQTRSHRQKMAEAVVQGILSYYAPSKGAKPGTQQAKARR